MTGEKADVEYCTVDFIKQDLVSPAYKDLSLCGRFSKGKGNGILDMWEVQRMCKGISPPPPRPNSLSLPVWTPVTQANKLLI